MHAQGYTHNHHRWSPRAMPYLRREEACLSCLLKELKGLLIVLCHTLPSQIRTSYIKYCSKVALASSLHVHSRNDKHTHIGTSGSPCKHAIARNRNGLSAVLLYYSTQYHTPEVAQKAVETHHKLTSENLVKAFSSSFTTSDSPKDSFRPRMTCRQHTRLFQHW